MKTQPWIFLLFTLPMYYHHPLSAMESAKDRNLKIIAWTASAMGTQIIAKLIPKTTASQLEEKINLTINDIASMGTVATSLMAVSFAFSEDRKAKIQHFAQRFPVALLLAKMVTSKAIKQSTQHVPILKYYFGCPNKECIGTCNSCALRSIMLLTGILRVIV